MKVKEVIKCLWQQNMHVSYIFRLQIYKNKLNSEFSRVTKNLKLWKLCLSGYMTTDQSGTQLNLWNREVNLHEIDGAPVGKASNSSESHKKFLIMVLINVVYLLK